MRIERLFHGMIDGKVYLLKTDGLNKLLTDKSIQRLRELTIAESDRYQWFPTEQAVAVPHITMVNDEDGRVFVQNETRVMGIHDYLQWTNAENQFSKIPFTKFKTIPETFEAIEVE